MKRVAIRACQSHGLWRKRQSGCGTEMSRCVVDKGHEGGISMSGGVSQFYDGLANIAFDGLCDAYICMVKEGLGMSNGLGERLQAPDESDIAIDTQGFIRHPSPLRLHGWVQRRRYPPQPSEPE